MNLYEFKIATRYFFAKNKNGVISLINWFAFIGITLGVATLIVVMSVMNGYKIELLDRIVGINGHINLHVLNSQADVTRIKNKLQDITDIKNVAPLISGQAMISNNAASVGGLVRGMYKEDIQNKAIIANNIILGNLSDFGSNNIIIGEHLARTLGVTIGHKIQLIVPKTNSTILGKLPKVKTFNIIAIFNVGMYEYDSSTIFIDYDIAEKLVSTNQSNILEIEINQIDNVNNVINIINQEFPQQFYIQDWRQMNSSFFDAIEIERNVMFLILTLIILVASFNIISSLTMLVNDKRKQIAILRTIGASKNSILKIFLICGSFIGICGTVFGTILGKAFADNIENIRIFLSDITGVTLFDPVVYFLSTLPAKVEASDVSNIVIMSLTLSILATIYPAYKAANKDPAEAIRYE